MKTTLKTQFRDLRPLPFLLLLAAGIINAVGVTMSLAPVHLYNSGIVYSSKSEIKVSEGTRL